MASERIRTGMELELYVMGQCNRKMEGMSGPAKVRVLSHLMEAAKDEAAKDEAAKDERQQESFGAEASG